MRAESGRGIEFGLMALLAFSVLAFGATSDWAHSALMVWAALLFVLWWQSAARSQIPAAFEREG